ncbi:hypothetical protein JOB18_031692 [Solea senegalensis]|uniref:Uncharacterized protein n=2 Tax=Solea senegalensis TaxID=28829 RepID=A0AAV6QDA9_SOLSE|nr:hypothetical protein JOB18_031692 [Solea senegalensis]
MDMVTFTSLDENVIQALTVDEVKNLLGDNVDELKNYENQTQVESWIRAQYQSELDTLELGLTGGRADPTTVAVTTTTPPAPPQSTQAGATTPASGSATTGHGSRVRADVGVSLLVLLALFVMSQHVVV